MANDTQPNKLYRNLRNGTFKDVALEAGVALSDDGKARAGMGVDAADFDNSGRAGLAVTNFDNEMIGLYRPQGRRLYRGRRAMRAGIGAPSLNRLGFGCVFADLDLDGALDLVVANGHIDETVRNIRGNVGYAQPPLLFLNQGNGTFRDVARPRRAAASRRPRVGRGLAAGDFDRDGDVDLLMTTNNGPRGALPQRSVRRQPQPPVPADRHGVQPRRDRRDRPHLPRRTSQSRMVKSGSSYLSQSELPVTFGVGPAVTWPSGRTEEFKNLTAGRRTSAWRARASLRSMASSNSQFSAKERRGRLWLCHVQRATHYVLTCSSCYVLRATCSHAGATCAVQRATCRTFARNRSTWHAAT